MSEETPDLARLEAVIFAADEIASVAAIRRAIPSLTPAAIQRAVAEINEALAREGRPYEIAEVAGGYQFRTRPEFSDLIRASQPERKVRLSRAALESVAVIAYRQPITRAEIEELRCVDCGAVLKSLLDRDLIRIVGRRDAPGRPALYGTTSTFLSVFGLASLRDLPTLRELTEMLEVQGSPGPASAPHAEDDDADGTDVAEADDDALEAAPERRSGPTEAEGELGA